MAIKFITTDQASAQNGVKVLVYGDAGVGKTTLVATAPQPFVISAEAGLLSLRKHRIPGAEVTSYAELVELYQWVTRAAEARQFWTICLDSVSEIGERVLAHAKSTVKDPRQAYGALIDNMLTVIRAFRDLPMKHVYFSAKQEYWKDESGVAMFGPSMPGSKLGPGMPYYFDEVFHMGIGGQGQNKWRYLRTQPDFMYRAKDRSGALAEFEPPDLGQVFNKILAS